MQLISLSHPNEHERDLPIKQMIKIDQDWSIPNKKFQETDAWKTNQDWLIAVETFQRNQIFLMNLRFLEEKEYLAAGFQPRTSLSWAEDAERLTTVHHHGPKFADPAWAYVFNFLFAASTKSKDFRNADSIDLNTEKEKREVTGKKEKEN